MYMGLVQELHLENFYVRETWGSEDVPSKSCSVFNSYALTAFNILGKVERVFASDTMPSGLELTGGGPSLEGKSETSWTWCLCCGTVFGITLT